MYTMIQACLESLNFLYPNVCIFFNFFPADFILNLQGTLCNLRKLYEQYEISLYYDLINIIIELIISVKWYEFLAYRTECWEFIYLQKVNIVTV